MHSAPIPLAFDYDDHRLWLSIAEREDNIIYYGPSPKDSLLMHESFLNKNNQNPKTLTQSSYPFKFPSYSTMLHEIKRISEKNK